MIKSMIVKNYLGKTARIVFSQEDPEHGFLITKIDGLGPAKASINTTDIATNDGSIYNSARLSSRNIVLNLYFVKANSIEDVRQRSYEFFPIKRPVELTIETDNRLVKTSGYVESNEPDIFSKNETATVSIICPDPYFYAAGENEVTQTNFAGTRSLFEFPFENDSLSIKLLEVGEIIRETEKAIFYSGDDEVGITIKMKIFGPVSNISIINSTTRETMEINTNRFSLLSGDTIVINTSRGQKSIKVLRAGEEINILNCLDKDSNWIHLVKGDNVFSYTVEDGINNIQVSIDNQTIYEGI